MSNPLDGHPPVAPRSTYRLQLNLSFTFGDAAAIVPYLRALGVSDLYASPYLQARPGSLHGYDISDHRSLNPELGGEEGHARLTSALAREGMGHLLDIVPNHMGIGEPGNSWWMDVLENGPSSPFAPYFDIDWRPLKPELTGKVLLPVLGDQFGRVLERGELTLTFEAGRFRVHYYDQIFPVSPRSSALVLRRLAGDMARRTESDDEHLAELESVVRALDNLPSRDRSDPASVTGRRREGFVSRRRLMVLHDSSPAFREALEATLASYRGDPSDPRSFDDLAEILEDQPYRLAFWRVAAEEINYRRFFDINELAGVRVERPEVFDATHRLILGLIEEGKVTALRIDHPDGLFDPAGYLRRLQEEASARAGGGPIYVIVEKILTGDEPLPQHWPVAGTVGYEFMNRLNGLFVDPGNADRFTKLYESFIGDRMDFERIAYEKKKLILRVALVSELNVLSYLLNRISEKDRRFRDFTLGSLREALRETIACFPVYRTYVDAAAGEVGEQDVEHLDRAIRTAMRRNRTMSPSLFEFVRDILLLRWPEDLPREAVEEHALFVMKFQQLTGPVMAKGVEDTTFYLYNRLISLNEVGGEPSHFGTAPDALHEWLGARAKAWPDTMNSSTTHDTKRSEDVRARINVLSEMPDEWEAAVRRWAGWNAAKRGDVEGEPVPDANDEYLLYQTLVGAWPLTPADQGKERETFRERIQQYMEKATREAKVHTSWINPNEGYDTALRDFVSRLLGAGEEDAFRSDVAEFAASIAADGMINSLSQLLVKLACPGLPDVYQGQELWDFSLVDPDNRRPVDFEARQRLLDSLRGRLDGDRAALAEELLAEWRDGRIKMYVTHLGLQMREARPALFARGAYLPLSAHGSRAAHAFALGREDGEGRAIALVPRLPRTFREAAGGGPEEPGAWGDTRLELPAALEGSYRNLFTGRGVEARGGALEVGAALEGFPVALLIGE